MSTLLGERQHGDGFICPTSFHQGADAPPMPPRNTDDDKLDGEDRSNRFGDRDPENGADTIAYVRDKAACSCAIPRSARTNLCVARQSACKVGSVATGRVRR